MNRKMFPLLVTVAMLATTFASFVTLPKQAQAATNLENLVQSLKKAIDNAPETTQQVLIKLLDGIEVFLNTSKTGVSTKIVWTSDQRNEAKAKLDEGLAKVAEFRAKVQAINLESTTAITELKTLYDEGKKWWAEYRIELKVKWADILIENGNRTIDAAEKIQEKINKTASLLKEDQIVDTSNLKSLLNKLDEEIQESKNYMTEAIALVEKMRDSTKAKDVVTSYVAARLKVQKATANLLEDGTTVVNEIMAEIARLVEAAKNQ